MDMDALVAQAGPPTDTQSSPQNDNAETGMDALVTQAHESLTGAAQAQNAAMTNIHPDLMARAAAVGKQYGIPAAAVLPQLDQWEARAVLDKRNSIVAQDPKMASFVTDHPDAAGQMTDDMENLSFLGKHVDTLSSVLENRLGAFGAKQDWANLTQWGYLNKQEQDSLQGGQFVPTEGQVPEPDRPTYNFGGKEYWYQPPAAPAEPQIGMAHAAADIALQTVLKGAGQALSMTPFSQPYVDKNGDIHTTGADVENLYQAPAGALDQHPDIANISSQIASFWPLLTGEFAIPLWSLQGGGAAEEQAQAEGATPEQVIRAGYLGTASNAALMAMMSRLPIPEVAREPGALNYLKAKATQAVYGVPPMLAFGEASQMANTAIEQTYNPKAEYTLDNDRLIGSAATGAIFGLLAHSPLMHDTVNAAQSNMASTAFDNIMDSVKALKSQKRAPDAVQTFLDQRLGDNAGNVYVPAAKVAELYQSAKKTPGPDDGLLGKAVPDIAAQLQKAGPLGGDVVIPTSAYATHLAGTPADAALRDDIRLTPEGMSKRQQVEFQQKTAAAVAEMNKLMAEQPDSPEAKVFADMRDQAMNGGYTRSQAEQVAAVTAAHYSTFGQDIGQDPYELYRAQNIMVRGGRTGESATAPLEYARAQTGAEPAKQPEQAAETKAKTYPKLPREIKNPVLGFLKARGGIERGSVLDTEIKENGNVSPRWYAKKGQGIGDVDNIPLSEWRAQLDAGKEDSNGYVDRNYVLAAIREEMAGNPITRDTQKIIDEFGHDPEYARHIAETESTQEFDRLNSEIAEYHARELEKAEEAHEERLAISGAQEHPTQTRTLEDLENELRQENAATELRSRERANERAGGIGGTETGSEQRGEERGAADQSAGRQGEIPGTGGSGEQLGAAHEGRRLQPAVGQKEADEGLFDTASRHQKELFDNHVKALEEKLPPAPSEEQFKNKEQNQESKPGKSDLNSPIEDFGDKIAGAKKDLWKDYKKSLSDELPADVKDITLSKHFPEPDYEAMISAGADIRALAAAKAMRDEVPPKPQKSYKLERWGADVKALREFADKVINGGMSPEELLELMRSGGYRMNKFADRIELYSELGYPAFTKAKGWDISLGKYSVINGEHFNPPKELYTVTNTVQGRKSFGGMGGDKGMYETREDAVNALRQHLTNLPEGTTRSTQLDIYRVTKSGEIIIGKKVGAGKFIDLKGGFKDTREARAYLKENEQALLDLLAKKKEIRPERRGVNEPRVGEDYREGQNITPEKFAAEFGFRGVQFGNYVEQTKRAQDLNNAYDALHDLANIINVPTRALSLNGDLGLAFGARGSGGKRAAAAHYEPHQVVINLTKNSGAGSLGHEWWHALDNYFGKQREGAKAEDHLTQKPIVPTRVTQYGNMSDVSVRKATVDAYKGVVDAINASGLKKRSQELDKTRTKDYWSTQVEMTARAFESYLIDKAKERGQSNDYLANIVDEKAHKAIDEMTEASQPYPYPTAEEKPAINAAFDKLFETLKTRETQKGREFYQAGIEDNPRAKLTLAEGKKIITLFETKDKSSLLHELSHIWLEEMKDYAEQEGAPQRLLNNWNIIKDYIGHKEGEISEESHETFARSFEQYLMEGKAPSRELQGPFRRFKQWLTALYRSIAPLNVKLNDDVRGVFDRMLATDEQIKQMQDRQAVGQLFRTAKEAGMTDAEFKAYTEAAANATERAKEQLLAEAMAKVKKQQSREWNAAEEEIRPGIEEAIRNQQGFRALEWFKTGIMRDGQGNQAEIPKMALRRDALAPGVEESLPRGVKVLNKGAAPDDIAPLLGYDSGDAMLKDLADIGTTEKAAGRQSAANYLADQQVEAALKQKFSMSDEEATQRAQEMMNEATPMDLKLAELRALSKKAGVPVTFTKENIGAWADQHIQGMNADEARNTFQYVRAAAKAGRDAQRAVLAGKDDVAIQSLQRQMLNMALAERARNFADDYASGMKLFKKAAADPTRKSTDQTYMNQVHGILSSLGMKVRRDPEELANALKDEEGNTVSPQQFALGKAAMGRDIYLADFLGEPAGKQLSGLNVQQFNALRDTIDSLLHNGREEKAITVAGKKVALDGILTDIENNLKSFKERKPSEFINPKDAGKFRQALDAISSVFRSAKAELTKPERLFTWMDNQDFLGPLNSYVFRPIKDAMLDEFDRQKAMAEQMDTLAMPDGWEKTLKEVVPADQRLMDPDTRQPVKMTRKTMLAMALNTGNEGPGSNFDKLAEGYNWKKEDIRDFLNKNMTKADWDWVQHHWDVMGSLWPDIEEMERRMTGIAPPRVKPIAFETPHGTYEGGYYPIVYDKVKSNRAEQRALKNEDLFNSTYYRPSTPQGHTIARLNNYSDMISLDLDLMPAKMKQAIHDLAFREAVINADKILSNPRFMDAVKNTWGPEWARTFRPWLRDIANSMNDPDRKLEWADKILRYSRHSVATMGVGYRISTPFLHGASAATNSIDEIGAENFAKGLAEYETDRSAKLQWVLDKSHEVSTRMNNYDRDTRIAFMNNVGEDATVNAFRRYSTYAIAWLDRESAVPTWIGAYRKALAEGAADDDAVYYADKAVRNAHGAQTQVDLSPVQRGSEGFKMFTLFYGFFDNTLNRVGNYAFEARRAAQEGEYYDTAKILGKTVAYTSLLAALHGTFRGNLWSGTDSWEKRSGVAMASFWASLLPLTRDFASMAEYGHLESDTPMSRVMNAIGSEGKDIYRAATGGNVSSRWLQHAIETPGYILDLPLGQAASTSQFLWDVWDGKENPQDVKEWIHGIVYGPAKKKAPALQPYKWE